jgi:hypothetical protein
MSAAREVTAEFKSTAVTKFKLTVTKSGDGSGAVASGDGGINCGGDCEGEYESGTKLTLTATPASGSAFKGWNGACSGSGVCEVTMSAAMLVGAEFTTVQSPPPEEKPSGKKSTRLQKALAKCKKLKGKARSKCIKKAKKKFGRHAHRAQRRSRGRG